MTSAINHYFTYSSNYFIKLVSAFVITIRFKYLVTKLVIEAQIIDLIVINWFVMFKKPFNFIIRSFIVRIIFILIHLINSVINIKFTIGLIFDCS